MLGRDFAEFGVGRVTIDIGLGFFQPLFLVPAPADNPLARGRRLDGGLHLGHDVVPGFGAGEVEHHFGLAQAGEMPVTFDEAGHGHLPFEIDDLGFFADKLGNGFVAADSDDFAAARGQGLHERSVVVDGDDFAVAEHKICAGLGAIALSAAGLDRSQGHAKETNKQNHERHENLCRDKWDRCSRKGFHCGTPRWWLFGKRRP